VTTIHPVQARIRLVQAALRVLLADHTEPHAWADAEAEYAGEELALAARDLVTAIDTLPAGRQPIGWTHPQTNPEIRAEISVAVAHEHRPTP
jgi:hypothetical protein